MQEEPIHRRLTTIMAADVVGYSGLVAADEATTLVQLGRLRHEVIEPSIRAHEGRLFKTMGDGFLAEFASPVRALECAIAIQNGTTEMRLRIGIHLGDVVADQDDLLGDGVNVAARLEGVAEPGGITISRPLYDQVRDRVKVTFLDKGEVSLKNLPRPMQVLSVSTRTVQSDSAYPPLPAKPSIAVLPFQNMSGDPEQEYFADGMVEDIITALSRVKWFFVIARNSSFTYKGRAVDIKQIGRELGVRYVLEGSVRKAGNRVRITGQLIEAETGHHIWAERFEREYKDVFELQDEMTSAVAAAIEPTINLRELEKSKKRPTSDLSAYDYFLRAQPFIRQFDPQSYTQAEQLLRRAVSLDAQYSSALALLADCIGRQCIMGAQPYRERVLEAQRIAQQAVQADPEDGTALAIASWVHTILVGKHDSSREYAERALRLQPNSAFVCVNSGFGYLYRGELDAARHNFERALRINPLDPRNYFLIQGLGIVLFFERKFSEALSLLDRSIELAPSARVTWRYKAATLAHLGRSEDALEAVAVLRSLTPVQTLKEVTERTMIAHAWMRELYFGGLEKAGYE
ncbi:adenylate cyclase [Bradyrhizobium tropiciagri]|uniref:adenylate/guanylate cyclase domain-containing protein n=1 Tax=Bradyrhizobium tropiciagri TaxID=312253 RepID=UPI001BA4AC64|nr:adenylate cyclase [Bradyrhizobium tropiciagri]